MWDMEDLELNRELRYWISREREIGGVSVTGGETTRRLHHRQVSAAGVHSQDIAHNLRTNYGPARKTPSLHPTRCRVEFSHSLPVSFVRLDSNFAMACDVTLCRAPAWSSTRSNPSALFCTPHSTLTNIRQVTNKYFPKNIRTRRLSNPSLSCAFLLPLRTASGSFAFGYRLGSRDPISDPPIN